MTTGRSFATSRMLRSTCSSVSDARLKRSKNACVPASSLAQISSCRVKCWRPCWTRGWSSAEALVTSTSLKNGQPRARAHAPPSRPPRRTPATTSARHPRQRHHPQPAQLRRQILKTGLLLNPVGMHQGEQLPQFPSEPVHVHHRLARQLRAIHGTIGAVEIAPPVGIQIHINRQAARARRHVETDQTVADEIQRNAQRSRHRGGARERGPAPRGGRDRAGLRQGVVVDSCCWHLRIFVTTARPPRSPLLVKHTP